MSKINPRKEIENYFKFPKSGRLNRQNKQNYDQNIMPIITSEFMKQIRQTNEIAREIYDIKSQFNASFNSNCLSKEINIFLTRLEKFNRKDYIKAKKGYEEYLKLVIKEINGINLILKKKLAIISEWKPECIVDFNFLKPLNLELKDELKASAEAIGSILFQYICKNFEITNQNHKDALKVSQYEIAKCVFCALKEMSKLVNQNYEVVEKVNRKNFHTDFKNEVLNASSISAKNCLIV